MDHFQYQSGALCAERVAIADIARAVGTPFYVYSSATLTRHYQVFQEALAGMDHLICYAMKANSNQAVLRLMANLGASSTWRASRNCWRLMRLRAKWACAPRSPFA